MKYALWLWNISGISSGKIRKLREYASGAEELYGWPEQAFTERAGLCAEDAAAIVQSRSTWNPDEEWMRLTEKGISFVSLEQREYPERLRNITNAPYGLYYRGSLPPLEGKAVGIVGARNRSEYGRMAACRIGECLGKNGIAVISGMARGIDSDGHRGALDGGGRTWAVLGCGVDVCYPASNRRLYERILAQEGGILSEYPPGQEPKPGQFPMRNRIISGLSDCIIIVEARKKSGSLLTADYAMEQGRDVYAVPGRPGDPLSEGTNRLIYQGAGIYLGEEEFLKDLHLEGCLSSKINFHKKNLEKDEYVVYSLLDFCPIGLGTLLQKSALPLNRLLEILAALEDKGYIEESVSNYYIRRL